MRILEYGGTVANTDLIRSSRMAGLAVKRARLAQGLTQAALAAKVGIRQATISKLEAGEPATRMHILIDVLAALGMELQSMPRSTGSEIQDIF
jgi:HTH-type transcriptional regulator / antitoxin HipB